MQPVHPKTSSISPLPDAQPNLHARHTTTLLAVLLVFGLSACVSIAKNPPPGTDPSVAAWQALSLYNFAASAALEALQGIQTLSADPNLTPARKSALEASHAALAAALDTTHREVERLVGRWRQGGLGSEDFCREVADRAIALQERIPK